jgi:cold shock protein
MNIIVKVIISLAVAAVATVVAGKLPAGAPTLFAIIACATLATALLVSLPGRSAASTSPAKTPGKPAPGSKAAKASSPSATGDTPREQGKVKWFNISKGFGFITKDDGEEIFVHFRSIRGEGRRGLRDGQRVSFIVAQSDKGPQAEDVEGLE